VDPTTAERDLDLTKALFDHFGNMHCGVYLQVTSPGVVSLGDAASTPALEPRQEEDAQWA
jgi:uncharacterized protein YcbX